MRILLLGANGQVGHELRSTLAPLGELVVATRSGQLADGAPCLAADLSDAESLAKALADADADVIVNAAAYTAVDKAESEPLLAQRINAEAVGEIARWCAANDRRLVHYSTDYVFDGQGAGGGDSDGGRRPYREDDPTGPLGVYGQSKRAGERAITDSGCDHLIFRTAWVYAAGHGHNFLRTMLRLGAERDELRVVDDQIGSPTPASLIASVTADAIRKPAAAGSYHLTTSGQTSWAGFAKRIFELAVANGLLAKQPAVVRIATSEYPTPARRPGYSVLDGSRLAELRGQATPDWEQSLLHELGR
ncbi:MAG: dTDP-4-dehydrorhamnose reductase [Xanthomonadales bacterium]|nr:dTDP-4-dehydrorhamnose reductase [Xanthomonadales bacterium]